MQAVVLLMQTFPGGTTAVENAPHYVNSIQSARGPLILLDSIMRNYINATSHPAANC